MKDKTKAVELIKKKLEGSTFLTYDEISTLTGYNVKYLFKLKNDILDNKFTLEHGNKNRKPVNAISEEEKQKIISLYKRSNASIRRFCKFYHTRSYSCIYNILKESGLIK
mgnify:FL=1